MYYSISIFFLFELFQYYPSFSLSFWIHKSKSLIITVITHLKLTVITHLKLTWAHKHPLQGWVVHGFNPHCRDILEIPAHCLVNFCHGAWVLGCHDHTFHTSLEHAVNNGDIHQLALSNMIHTSWWQRTILQTEHIYILFTDSSSYWALGIINWLVTGLKNWWSPNKVLAGTLYLAFKLSSPSTKKVRKHLAFTGSCSWFTAKAVCIFHVQQCCANTCGPPMFTVVVAFPHVQGFGGN